MSNDDWDQRVEQHWYWRDKDIDAQLEAKAAAINHAIDRHLSGEELRIKYGTGPTDDSSDIHLDSGASEETGTPTAGEQFDAHARRLFVALENSAFLPDSMTQQWIREIREIPHHSPSRGLMVLGAIASEYAHARRQYKPQRDVWSLGIDQERRFDNEMDIIKRELDLLETILEHVEAYLKE